MDFYTFLTLAAIFTGIGYLLGSHERKRDQHGLPRITTPDNSADVIANLQGQVAIQRDAMRRWSDAAKELGFDGVSSALESIRQHRHTKVRMIASAKGYDGQHKVAEIIRFGRAGGTYKDLGA